MCVCVYVLMYVYMYVCMYVCMYVNNALNIFILINIHIRNISMKKSYDLT